MRADVETGQNAAGLDVEAASAPGARPAPSASSPLGPASRWPAILQDLLEEVTRVKETLREVLKFEPENKDYHRVYGMYVGHVLDIHKELLKTLAVDKDRLLLESLRAVVAFLLENGEEEAAGKLGGRLEEIGEKIKERWENLKTLGVTPSAGSSPKATRKSAPPSLPRSRRSAVARRPKKISAENGP